MAEAEKVVLMVPLPVPIEELCALEKVITRHHGKKVFFRQQEGLIPGGASTVVFFMREEIRTT